MSAIQICVIILYLMFIGNIWGQSWTNLLDVTLPYPGKTYPDVTQEMRAQVRFSSFLFFFIMFYIILQKLILIIVYYN